MEIGISTGFVYDKSIFDILPAIRAAGFSHVELWSGPIQRTRYVHFDWHQKSQVDELRSRLGDLGITPDSIHAPFSESFDISSADENCRLASVNETIRVAEVFKTLGGRTVVIHPASTPFVPDERDYRFGQSSKSIADIAAAARELGLKLAVENQLPHIIGSAVPSLLSMIGGLPADEVGICFDTSHANLYKDLGVTAAFKALAGRVITMHVSDNMGLNDDHFAPGEGNIDWPSFITVLAEKDYPGIFMLEVMRRPGQDNYAQTLRSIHQKVSRLITDNYHK